MTFGSDKDNFGVFKGIKLNVNFGLDYRNQSRMSYMNMYHGNQATAGGLLTKYNTRMQSYTFNNCCHGTVLSDYILLMFWLDMNFMLTATNI